MGLDKPLKAAKETEKEHFRTFHTAKMKAEMEQVTEEITDHVEERVGGHSVKTGSADLEKHQPALYTQIPKGWR